MKIQLTRLFLLFSFCYFGFQAQGQNCDPFYPMDAGVKFEMTTYSAKDKVTGYQRHEVLSNTGSDGHLEATIKMTHFDKKNKEVFDTDYDVICDGNNFHIDMRSRMPYMNSSGMNMDMDIQSENLDFPTNLSAGMDLPDASLKVVMASNSMGISMGGISVLITERRVSKMESITTPAGTFECFVVLQKESSKTMGIKINSTSKTWYNKGAGVVRGESYDKKGKLSSYSVLTSLER